MRGDVDAARRAFRALVSRDPTRLDPALLSAAGALGVELVKGGHFRLGDPRRPLGPPVVDDAVALSERAMALAVLLAVATPTLLAAAERLAQAARQAPLGARTSQARTRP